MRYMINAIPLKGRNDHVKAVGILMIGDDIRIKCISIMENSKGELFVVMPNKITKKLDEEGKPEYKEICHPINSEVRKALNEAAIESYKEGHPVTLYENKDGCLMVNVEVYDSPFFNKLGKATLKVNENFVIEDVFVCQKKDGNGIYVSFPNYRTNKTDAKGHPLYEEIVSIGSGFRKKLSEAIINEYELELERKAQNRISIKSRLSEAKEKAESNAPLKDKEMTPKQMEVS